MTEHGHVPSNPKVAAKLFELMNFFEVQLDLLGPFEPSQLPENLAEVTDAYWIAKTVDLLVYLHPASDGIRVVVQDKRAIDPLLEQFVPPHMFAVLLIDPLSASGVPLKDPLSVANNPLKGF